MLHIIATAGGLISVILCNFMLACWANVLGRKIVFFDAFDLASVTGAKSIDDRVHPIRTR